MKKSLFLLSLLSLVIIAGCNYKNEDRTYLHNTQTTLPEENNSEYSLPEKDSEFTFRNVIGDIVPTKDVYGYTLDYVIGREMASNNTPQIIRTGDSINGLYIDEAKSHYYIANDDLIINNRSSYYLTSKVPFEDFNVEAFLQKNDSCYFISIIRKNGEMNYYDITSEYAINNYEDKTSMIYNDTEYHIQPIEIVISNYQDFPELENLIFPLKVNVSLQSICFQAISQQAPDVPSHKMIANAHLSDFSII